METFEFYLDTKVTTWMRTPFEVEADTLEEAKQKAIEFHKQGNTSSIAWDEQMDAQEQMSVEENGGQPTEELFAENGDCIWANVTDKDSIIKRITDILKVNGCFSISELDGETPSICYGELGSYVGLLEYFTEDYVEMKIYDPSSTSSDEIDSDEIQYDKFNKDTLDEILFVVEQWEAQCIRDEKRISD